MGILFWVIAGLGLVILLLLLIIHINKIDRNEFTLKLFNKDKEIDKIKDNLNTVKNNLKDEVKRSLQLNLKINKLNPRIDRMKNK